MPLTTEVDDTGLCDGNLVPPVPGLAVNCFDDSSLAQCIQPRLCDRYRPYTTVDAREVAFQRCDDALLLGDRR
ncbi:MAG: hypothetical protein JWO67_1528 [Streptosporangiaceae bacterium]|nr:hypothetical protein [Streptosporangiaceae bacterium]